MNRDLYAPEESTIQATSSVSQNQTNFADFFPNNFFDFDILLYWGLIITLAWTIFYTIVFVIDFFYYRVQYPDGEFVTREKVGVESLFKAINLWWGFILCLIFYTAYFLQQDELIKILIGIVTLLVYLMKIFIADMPSIPVIGKMFGKPGSIIQSSLDNFFSSLTSAITAILDGVFKVFGG